MTKYKFLSAAFSCVCVCVCVCVQMCGASCILLLILCLTNSTLTTKHDFIDFSFVPHANGTVNSSREIGLEKAFLPYEPTPK